MFSSYYLFLLSPRNQPKYKTPFLRANPLWCSWKDDFHSGLYKTKFRIIRQSVSQRLKKTVICFIFYLHFHLWKINWSFQYWEINGPGVFFCVGIVSFLGWMLSAVNNEKKLKQNLFWHFPLRTPPGVCISFCWKRSVNQVFQTPFPKWQIHASVK